MAFSVLGSKSAHARTLLFFTLNREDFSFVIHLDRQPRTSGRTGGADGVKGA